MHFVFVTSICFGTRVVVVSTKIAEYHYRMTIKMSENGKQIV